MSHNFSYYFKNGSAVKLIFNLILIGIGIFFLLIPAFANGFPIMFSDVGAYIGSGFSKTVPIDRPIVYGLFIRQISMAYMGPILDSLITLT